MMKTKRLLLFLFCLPITLLTPGQDLSNPIVSEELVFDEKNGQVAVEAEYFYKQSNDEIRQWYRSSKNEIPKAGRDDDPQHCFDASNNSYLEILPDKRVSSADKLIAGENFSNVAGQMAILSYKVNISTPGRYYVWVRAFSTGAEDNGLHVGVDNKWPEHGQRMQWCEGKNMWTWASKQRTEAEHCGVPKEIWLDIDEAGIHDIQFSMREDGFEFDKFILTRDINYIPEGQGFAVKLLTGKVPAPFPIVEADSISGTSQKQVSAEENPENTGVKSKDGKGEVVISGELKQWHKVTLTLNGPFASENDTRPNPFTDYRMTVTFTHESGSPVYSVPGYFAADGNAGETSASEGIRWRAHLAPDLSGLWFYKVSFLKGAMVATADLPWMKALAPYNGIEGSFQVAPTDKTGRDFRGRGRLEYVGKHHLQFKGSGEYFYKAGADAPETLLGYEDFDSTIAMKPKVPLKKYLPHINDFQPGDPTWKNGKGKGLIGAINYLAGKGVNSFSFLTYNAGGDGDNIWPFVSRDEKFHYDCSKLDQWQIVFDHAQSKGMYLHFKTQENENDDNIKGQREPSYVPESMDGGDLGPERILYYRELIARFGYILALNWNLGEENTQSTEQRKACAEYLHNTDPYRHNIVLHTFPQQQDTVYTPLLGNNSELTGVSLQNSWNAVFKKTLKWVNESDAAGKPWVVANDEQGSSTEGVPPDPGYKGFDGAKLGYDINDIRKQTLWANIMAGGAGVEYYFGYQLPENDLICEDFRSRDKSWDYCRIAVNFLADHKIPFQDMKNMNVLIGNNNMSKDKFCLAKENEIYLVYLAYVPNTTLDLTGVSGNFTVEWFNPVAGGKLLKGSTKTVKGGKVMSLGNAPLKADQDWLVIVRKNE